VVQQNLVLPNLTENGTTAAVLSVPMALPVMFMNTDSADTMIQFYALRD